MSDVKRVAIVTGASRGLGKVVSAVLAEHGYDLVVGGRDDHALLGAAEALRHTGRRVATVHGDLADAWVRSWLIYEARRLGGLDVLVNNASELGGIRPVTEVSAAVLDRVFRVNVVAPVALLQLARPLLAERHGLVVNVSSDAARVGYPGWGAYGSTKAALDLLSKTLDVELRDAGISVVSVDPGDMRTRMHQEAFPGEDISDRPLPEITIPFWQWLFDQEARTLSGQRLGAQQEEKAWLQPA
jgi:NAD(P)-dependent dehydrogenase (short-subunit alcohol dehydrogenase family)